MSRDHIQRKFASGTAEKEEFLHTGTQVGLRGFVTKHEYLLFGLSGIGLFVGVWSVISMAGFVPEYLIPPPHRVATSLGVLFTSGKIWPHLWFSVQEFLLGYSLAAVGGIAVGLLMGWYKRVNYLLEMLVSALYSTPRIAFIPLFLIFFGVIGILKTAATVFIMAFVPILMNTLAGVRLCEGSYVKVGRALHATDSQLIRDVVIPGSFPSIIAGLRLGTSLGLTALVVGDLYGAQAGLGHLLFLYANAFRTSEMMAVILLFSITGVSLNMLLKRVENYFSVWRPSLAE
ncbi:ABC transporter permease [[Eubacterium] cellulosolvens]